MLNALVAIAEIEKSDWPVACVADFAPSHLSKKGRAKFAQALREHCLVQLVTTFREDTGAIAGPGYTLTASGKQAVHEWRKVRGG